jgi:hypothetical protein
MSFSLLLPTHRFDIILWISRLDVNNGFYICEGEEPVPSLLIRIFDVLYFLMSGNIEYKYTIIYKDSF